MPIVAKVMAFPLTAYRGSLFPTSSPTFVVACFHYDSCSTRGEFESQCHFDLHFFIAKDIIYFFTYLLANCTSFENYLIHFPFSNLIICLIFCVLHIFWILIPCQMNN
jgi:hypothetical protein